MAPTGPTELRFVPSRAEGLPDVREVVVFSDRLEVNTAGEWVTFLFVDMARWPKPTAFWRWMYRCGRPPKWLPVGERDWFHEPPNRFFRFFTDPPLILYMPVDEPEGYSEGNFSRAQRVMQRGGFQTWDLG